MNSITVGTILPNRYVVQRLLGRGGMGTVYLAEDRRLAGKQVVIKELDAAQLPPAERAWRLQAFKQEVQVLAALSHPGLAAVTDFFDKGTCAYLVVIEYVPGETLEELLGRSPGNRLPEGRALDIARQPCDVLTYLHTRYPPIIFRDLKPGNSMLQPDGWVKVIDFGITISPNYATRIAFDARSF